MSTLTKIFIVFHVVLSLMLAAGIVVFVNRVENFRTSMAAQTTQINQKQTELGQAKTQVAALQSNLDAVRTQLNTAVTEGQKQMADDQAAMAVLNGQLAQKTSDAKIQQVTLDNATAALVASEDQRKHLGDTLAQTRTDNDTLNRKNSDMNIAISDLTSQLDVAVRKNTDFSEQLAEAKGKNDQYAGIIKDHGIPLDQPMAGGLSIGAPMINGVVRDTRTINGIPYATISVGSVDNVTKGMVFQIIDRTHGQFLGQLTVDSVDLHQATGKLEGPNIADVRMNTEVRTQL